MKIDINKKYRTRDGEEVRLYEDDGEEGSDLVTIQDDYLRRQAECGLKVGDTVRITRMPQDEEDGWVLASPLRNINIAGISGKVISISRLGIAIEMFSFSGPVTVPYFVLEKVEQETNRFLTKYTGDAGSGFESLRADRVFNKGQLYEVTGGSMGQSSTSIKLKGCEGLWNSVLFDIDVHNCPLIENLYQPVTPECPVDLSKFPDKEGYKKVYRGMGWNNGGGKCCYVSRWENHPEPGAFVLDQIPTGIPKLEYVEYVKVETDAATEASAGETVAKMTMEEAFRVIGIETIGAPIIIVK